ncbi:hypothetical protein [Peribacillus sp. Hz7]|uniref:hypothetical protein n=1 Tax=Peribacillus sp. Hz7 TaxID=3344873 RepID=UPI0035C9AEF6
MDKVKTTFTYTQEMIEMVKCVALLKNKHQNEIIEEAFMYWLDNQDKKFVNSLRDIIRVSKNM